MRLRVDGGAGTAEIAALTAAIEALLGDEAAAQAGDLSPAVYRSQWRTTGIHEGTLAFEHRAD